MGLAQDVDQHLLIHVDPVCWRETTGRTPAVFGLNDEKETGHKALKEMQHVAHRLHAVTKCWPHGAMKDHLPLDATLGREEGRGVYGEFQLHGRTARYAS